MSDGSKNLDVTNETQNNTPNQFCNLCMLQLVWTMDTKSNESTRNAAMNISPVHVEQSSSIMRVGSCENKDVEQLMAMASNVEETWLPAFGNPCDVDCHPQKIKQAHANLIPQSLDADWLVVEEDDLVCPGYKPGQPHGREGDGSHGPVLGCLENRHHGHGHGENANERNGRQVDVPPHGLA